jgi:hypothetical protein
VKELPVACSLTGPQAAERAEEFRELARRALAGRDRRDGALLLRFRSEPGVAEQVEDLAARERECCPFLEVEVGAREGEVELSIAADPEARSVLDAFYELTR